MNFLPLKISNTNKLIIKICSFTLITGLSSGFFLVSIMPSEEKHQLISFIQETADSHQPTPSAFILYNLFLLALILCSALSYYGIPLAILFLFCKSMFMGICIPLILTIPSNDCILLLLLNIVLIILFLLITIISMDYGLSKSNSSS